MGKKEQFKTSIMENVEIKEPTFNFSEIAGFKEGMVTLVQKLQANIDAGKYDALISDEVGGRIPTLILRKIIKARHPDAKIDTHFIASGKSYFPRYDSLDYHKLVDYLKSVATGKENVLLVTQYAHSGGTLAGLILALRESGVPHIDAAVLNSLNTEEYLYKYMQGMGQVFVGTRDGSTIEFHERATRFAGVAKTKEYNPTLSLLKDVIAKEGRAQFMSMEEWREMFGITRRDSFKEMDTKMKDPEKVAKYEAWDKGPLSEAELKEIQETVRKAREDVDMLSQEVLSAVWQ